MGKRRENLMSAAAMAALLPLAAMQPATAQEGTAPPLVLDALTVTAAKRPQALADVDGAVSVRTAEDLERAGVSQVRDLEKVFPGLIIRERANQAYSNVTVRGVTSSDYYNPAVQVYVDGVPQDPAYFTQDLLNVERVELLRGPQGTLYGRNAHGGVVNIITRQPDDTPRTTVNATAAVPRQAAGGAVSLPLVPGTLYGSVAATFTRDEGRIDDIATGEEGIDDSRGANGRLSLRYAPTGGPLDVRAAVQRDELVSHEELYIREANLHDRRYDSATQGPVGRLDREVTSASLAADLDLGPGTLSSVTATQDRTLQRFTSGFDFPEEQQSVSQELRYAVTDAGPWSGVAGAFFQDTAFTRTDFGFPGFTGRSDNDVDSRSYAVFGEATYAVTPAVDLTAGLRWSREEAEIDYARAASLMPALAFQAEDGFEDISPKAAVGWQVNPDHRLFAVLSRGFKPGGYNHTVSGALANIAYDSETSTNAEIGWRGSLFGGDATVQASAYWIQAEDKQIYVGPIGAQYLRNVGDARSVGAELEASIRATDDLILTVGSTAGRSTFEDAVDPVTGADYDGNRLPYAPDYTSRVEAQYFLPSSFLAGSVLDGALSLRGAATYTSRIYFDEANALDQGGTALFDLSLDLATEKGATFSLFADNITDKIYRTSSFDFGGGDIRSTVGEGRVVGLRGSVTF